MAEFTLDVMGWWKEYTENLLNPTNMPHSEEAESGDLRVDSPITRAKVTEVVKKLLSDKPLGVYEVCLEFLKALDVVGLII